MAFTTEYIVHNDKQYYPNVYSDFVGLDGRLSFFVDSSGVTRRDFDGYKPLQALQMSKDLQNRIIESVELLDGIIELDFSFVNTQSDADITIALHDSGSPEDITYSGLATIADLDWDWDIDRDYINKVIFREGEISFEKYYHDNTDSIDPNYLLNSQATIAHELGHALGLEHPMSGSDGDKYQGPELTRDDTIMLSTEEKAPYQFRPMDIQALQEIWGAETGNISPLGPKQFTPAWLNWASRLWDFSEKDGIIEYFVDKKGELNNSENTRFSKNSMKFIKQLIGDAESVTGLSFEKSKDPDSIISFESKRDEKSVDVSRTKKGFEIEIDDMSGMIDDAAKSRATKYFGYVLGLDDMKGKYFSTADSTMSPNFSQYNSFTQSDQNTLEQVWDHLSNA